MTTRTARTTEQRRAAHAAAVVESIVARHIRVRDGKRSVDPAGSEFGVRARKMPTRIMASGLGQTLAFMQAKSLAEPLRVGLADWLLDKRRFPDSNNPPPAADELLKRLIHGDADYLRLATAEALAYLKWVVRFADAAGLTDSGGET